MRQSDAMKAGGALAVMRDLISETTIAAPGRDQIERRREIVLAELDGLLSITQGDESRRAVVVIVGATGTGKSSLFNALAGQPISPTGERRPTTSRAVIWYEGAKPQVAGPGSALVAGRDPLLQAVVLIDCPDFDSTMEEHRQLVEELVRRADLCLFIASAKRYADEAAWSILSLARHRGLPTYLILNRLPRSGADAILEDYVKYLRRAGILMTARSPRLLLIPEQELQNGLLPADAVAPLRRYLESIQRDDVRRDLLDSAWDGRLEGLATDAEELADEIDVEARLVTSLEEAAGAAFTVADGQLRKAFGAQIRPEALEATVAGLGQNAVAATVMAWTSVGVDLPSIDHAEWRERVQKALAEWQGRVPEDRDVADLQALLTEEGRRYSDLAASWAPPAGLSSELRDLCLEIRSRA